MSFFRSFIFKYVRFFVAGLVLFLLIESGVLLYYDRQVLPEKTNVHVSVVSQPKTTKPKGLKVTLDSSAQDVEVSSDGVYLAYTSGGALHILNITNAKVIDIPMAENMQLSYYKWLYDRNRLVIAEKSTADYDYYAKLYYFDMSDYDASSGTSTQPVEITNNVDGPPREAKIQLGSKSSEVTGLDFSTNTVITYVKVSGKTTDRMWKISFPSDPTSYDISVYHIGDIQCLKYADALMYEDKDNGRVNVAGKGSLVIDGKTQFHLLGFDSSDRAYFASGSGDTTSLIYYGSVMNGANVNLNPTMQSVALPQPVSIDSISITADGQIYENDKDAGVVKNLVTGAETSYQGNVLGFYESSANGFITDKAGDIEQNTLK